MPVPYPDELNQYIAEHSTPETPLLTELARATRAHTDDPGMMVGHVQGTFLRLIVRMLDARRVLELGTFTGYSTLAMAEGLPDGGEIITCDINPETTAIARQYWDRSPHGSKIRLRLGPALRTIQALDGPFDLVFIDADKQNYSAYWDACVPRLRRGGVILVDNALWSGRVVDPGTDEEIAIDAFNKHIRADQRVEHVLLSIRDGLMMAVRV
jgi:caffeoyl-CoA O-methyltransferase